MLDPIFSIEGAAPHMSRLRLAQGDYDKVRRALEFITDNAAEQPGLPLIAGHVGLSETHLNELFRRWAGLTPKAFLQAVTLQRARELLRNSASVLEAALESGLSGPGRLHDLFVTYESMSPGEWKARGAGLTFLYGFHPSPFGEAIVVASPRGLAGMGWVDEKAELAGDQDSFGARNSGKHAAGRAGALEDMKKRWPKAIFLPDQDATALYAARAFEPDLWQPGTPLRVMLIGSDFEVRVWQTLLCVPVGGATTYSGIAGAIGKPGAARAVGAAVGRNPLSFVVPCHRVLARDGALTGYHWGVIRKQAILGWEAGQVAERRPA